VVRAPGDLRHFRRRSPVSDPPLNAERTLLRQEETFSGLLVRLFGNWIGGGALRGFPAMNKSAKSRLEGE
jgi:hypothetical protein